MLSSEGLSFIKSWEGFRGRVYKDSVGLPTIGFGHLIKASESNKYRDAYLMSQTEALVLLGKDLARVEDIVDAAVKTKITLRQRDALVSLVFNIGVGAFLNSTLLRKLNYGDQIGAAAEFPRWCHGGKPAREITGLKRRREAERRVFAADIPGAGKLHLFRLSTISITPLPLDATYSRWAKYAA